MNIRRRGDDLQTEIYNVTYEILDNEGYDEITFSKVAKFANTSRSVLYRYWDKVFDLVLETIMYKISNSNNELVLLNFDKGNLRNNLLYIGRKFIEQAKIGPNKHFRILFINASHSHQKELKQLIDIANQSNLKIMDYALALAINKNEINHMPSNLVKLTYFQLLRYYDWISLEVLSPVMLEQILDEIILPSIEKSNQ